jgi:hypothetical protein
MYKLACVKLERSALLNEVTIQTRHEVRNVEGRSRGVESSVKLLSRQLT